MRQSICKMSICKIVGVVAMSLGAGCAFADDAKLTQSVAALSSTQFIPEARFQESIDEFAAADRAKAPKTGGVVFVGSSSIRMWNTLETQFDNLPVVVRRGFGGSRMSDCTRYLQNLVTPYKPKLVVVYAGDNDLNEGARPLDVLKSFTSFVEGVRKELPKARIAYVSIKPSPSRANLIPAIRETNRMIATYVRNTDNLDYIDVFTPMMNALNQPRMELFGPDMLHMNADGYALWKDVISGHVQLQ